MDSVVVNSPYHDNMNANGYNDAVEDFGFTGLPFKNLVTSWPLPYRKVFCVNPLLIIINSFEKDAYFSMRFSLRALEIVKLGFMTVKNGYAIGPRMSPYRDP